MSAPIWWIWAFVFGGAAWAEQPATQPFRNLVPTQEMSFPGPAGGKTLSRSVVTVPSERGLYVSVAHAWGFEVLTVHQVPKSKVPKGTPKRESGEAFYEVVREESNGMSFGPGWMRHQDFRAAQFETEKDFEALRRYRKTFKTDCVSGHLILKDPPDRSFEVYFCSGDAELTEQEKAANRIVLRFSRSLSAGK